MTSFAKANETFTTKNTSTSAPSNQTLGEFTEQFSEGGVIKDQPTPVPNTTQAGGTAQETFVNNASFGADPLTVALGSSWGASNGSVSPNITSDQFVPTAFMQAHSVAGQTLNTSSPGSYMFGGAIENVAVSTVLENQLDNIDFGRTIPYAIYDMPIASSIPAKTMYNFYIQDYEDFLGRLEENETSLLDIYGTVLSLTSVDGESELNSLAERRANGVSLTNGLQVPRRNDEISVPSTSVETFFKRYATEQVFQNDRYTNVFFPADRVAEINSVFSNSQLMFPFYAGFDINMAESSEISDNLKSSKFANTMMRNVAATLDNGDVFQRESYVRNTQEGNFNATIKTWDLMELLDYSDPGFISRSTVLGNEEELAETFPEAFYQFASNVDRISFLSGLQNTIRQNALSFSDIVNGKKCYSEVVMYRVAKYRPEDLNSPFQNFFFFNSSEVDKFKFLDSQVKPGQEYFYKVFTYSVVVSAEYSYNETIGSEVTRTASGEPRNFVGVSLTNNVSMKVVENVVQTTRTFVVSRPPIYPQASFRSFIGEDKKIQILLQDRSDLLEEQAVSLDAEEVERMVRIRTAQGIGIDDPVKFSNDDGIKVYDIYRTTTPPETVRDFATNRWRRVTEKEILDKVKSDTTYYYMFRSVDNHGNVSNPSSVFEVTLIGGVSPYLLVSDYEYPVTTDSFLRPEKKFKRFLRIRPALQQLLLKRTPELISKRSSADVFNVQVGIAPEGTLWGKKYKIRIKSIETGKKMDFNIDYNYKFEHRDE
jgi:hypothetical protein